MKKLALALAVSAAFVGQATAADMAVKARPAPPPPPPIANWTGCYISGSVGYGLFDNETSGSFTGPPVTPLTPRTDFGGRGSLAGGGGGCDYQFGFGGGGGIFGTGQFVIGFLADYYWSDMRGDRGSPSVGNFFTAQQKVDQQWAVGGRVSEYDRVNRAEFNNALGFNGAPGTPTGFVSSDKLFTQTVMTSLVYRFNFWGAPPVAARY